MCGICGIYRIAPDDPIEGGTLESMKAIIAHRGPDQEGTHIEPHIGLGHQRLSIIGVATGRQPLANEDDTVWVAFNGEIYNYRPLRDWLIGRGHQFRTQSDTEVLVHLYEEKGVDFVRDLRGMFAIALWDRPRRKLVLVRDRLGKKPLYWRADKRGLVFGSEIKSILVHPDVARTPNLVAMHHYLSLAYMPAPMTAFDGISSLPAGHLLEVTDGKVDVRRYWQVDFRPEPRSMDDMVDELDTAFDESVRVRLESEVPLGVFLSGGVDSSAVAERMTAAMPSPPLSTTIRFEDPAYDESTQAAELAALLNTEHVVRDIGPGSTDVVEQILWHFDEPFADPSALPTYFLCKAARESLTVALSGDGGDEMFAGYGRYAQVAFEERLRGAIPGPLRKLLAPLEKIYPRHARGRMLLENLNRSAQAAAASTFFQFGDAAKASLYSANLLSQLAQAPSTNLLFEQLWRQCGDPDPVACAQFVDYNHYLVDDILVKVDRMSMAHSLEVRSPLLDHELVERVATFPRAAKLHDGTSKYVFKRMLERHLPAGVLHRPKRGFAVPLHRWFRGELKAWIEDLLFDGRLLARGYFDDSYLRGLWRAQQRGGRRVVDMGGHFWVLAMLELWHRMYIDSDAFLSHKVTG